MALTVSLLFLPKLLNPSSLVLYPTSSILPFSHPPSLVPGSAAQSGLSTSQACLSNYRPISILPACNKLLERHVKEQVTESTLTPTISTTRTNLASALGTQLNPFFSTAPSTWPEAVCHCSLSWCFKGLWLHVPSTLAFQTSLPWSRCFQCYLVSVLPLWSLSSHSCAQLHVFSWFYNFRCPARFCSWSHSFLTLHKWPA